MSGLVWSEGHTRKTLLSRKRLRLCPSDWSASRAARGQRLHCSAEASLWLNTAGGEGEEGGWGGECDIVFIICVQHLQTPATSSSHHHLHHTSYPYGDLCSSAGGHVAFHHVWFCCRPRSAFTLRTVGISKSKNILSFHLQIKVRLKKDKKKKDKNTAKHCLMLFLLSCCCVTQSS